MAKGQKRGNREHKKPKQLKPKAEVSAGTAPTSHRPNSSLSSLLLRRVGNCANSVLTSGV